VSEVISSYAFAAGFSQSNRLTRWSSSSPFSTLNRTP